MMFMMRMTWIVNDDDDDDDDGVGDGYFDIHVGVAAVVSGCCDGYEGITGDCQHCRRAHRYRIIIISVLLTSASSSQSSHRGHHQRRQDRHHQHPLDYSDTISWQSTSQQRLQCV